MTIVGCVRRRRRRVAGDGDRILQIVSNLLDNAVRWTPEGGVVTLDAGGGRGRRAHRRRSTPGPGVPVAKREHVFRPFYSEDDARHGPGPGHRLGAGGRHGRRASAVDDAPGGGARFTVTLPLRAAGTSVRSPSPA